MTFGHFTSWSADDRGYYTGVERARERERERAREEKRERERGVGHIFMVVPMVVLMIDGRPDGCTDRRPHGCPDSCPDGYGCPDRCPHDCPDGCPDGYGCPDRCPHDCPAGCPDGCSDGCPDGCPDGCRDAAILSFSTVPAWEQHSYAYRRHRGGTALIRLQAAHGTDTEGLVSRACGILNGTHTPTGANASPRRARP